MNDIERAIETQQKLITNWEQRIQELEEVIKKYPWGRDGLKYDFGDWRETELKRRKEQIKIALIIISALEKQTPKIYETSYNLGLYEYGAKIFLTREEAEKALNKEE